MSTASANYDEQESQIVIEVSPQDCQVLTQDEYINDLVITQNLTPEQAIQKAEEDYKKINQISPRSQLAKYTDTISADHMKCYLEYILLSKMDRFLYF